MTKISGKYLGDLRCSAIHLNSQSEILSDAPTDNHGKGEKFSPTDLMATSLAMCMMTIMGIEANKKQIDLGKISFDLNKLMGSNPRKIKKVEIEFKFNKTFSKEEQKIIEEAAKNCPVALSLSTDITQEVIFKYAQEAF